MDQQMKNAQSNSTGEEESSTGLDDINKIFHDLKMNFRKIEELKFSTESLKGKVEFVCIFHNLVVKMYLEHLNKMSKELGSDLDSLRLKKSKLDSEKIVRECDVESLQKEKTEFGKKLEVFGKEKELFQSFLESFKRLLWKAGGGLESLYDAKFELALINKGTPEPIDKALRMHQNKENIDKDTSELLRRIELLEAEIPELQNGFEFLTEETTKLKRGYEFLNEDTTEVRQGIEFLTKKKTKFESEIESLNDEKTKLRADIELLNNENATLNAEKNGQLYDIESLNKEKSKLRADIELLNNEKATLNAEKTQRLCDIHQLDKEKCGLQSGIKVLITETANQGIGIDVMNNEKVMIASEIELLNNEKAMIASDVELLNQEKNRLHADVEWLKEEKDTLHADLVEEKDAFIHSAISEVFARDTQEFQEAQQELIKQMESEKVTRNTVIGVKEMRGEPEDQVLWNYRENRRATLKEVISSQWSRAGKQQ